MNFFFAALATLLAADPVSAATLLAVTPDGGTVVRASMGEIAALDPASLRPAWSGAGVSRPARLVVSADGRWAAAIDPIANRVAVADLVQRSARGFEVAETPIAAVFADGALLILSRDGHRLTRIEPSTGSTRSIDVPPGSSHLLAARQGVIVYSSVSGAAARVDAATLEVLARAMLPRFGSDLATEGGSGYLVEPRSGRLTVFSVDTLAAGDQRTVGAVPVDLEVEAPANAARGARIAIADPASKRIWRDEGAQSTAAAVGRGFLRGLLGLGLYRPGSAGFPSGIDRVVATGGSVLAFDSSTETLYGVRGDRATELARGLPWGSFAVVGDDVLLARGDTVERIRLH